MERWEKGGGGGGREEEVEGGSTGEGLGYAWNAKKMNDC